MPDFAVVAEDDTDARMAFLLANRIFLEEGPDWMDQAYLPNWVDLQGQGYPPGTQGGEPQPRCTKWSQLGNAGFNKQFLRSLGRDSSGQPQGFDYARGRKAVFLFKQLRQTRLVDALILVRDLDDQATKRRKSLEQVRIDSPEIVLVLATPNPKQEAWVLNGFIPSKVQLIEVLISEGIRKIEATSFVSPKWAPQMADAEAVLEAMVVKAGQWAKGLILPQKAEAGA